MGNAIQLGKMKRRMRTLQNQLGRLGPCMRGTVVVIGTRNKQHYFSLNKNKKTRLIIWAQSANRKPGACRRPTSACSISSRK